MLDDIPVASIVFIASIVLIVIAYCLNDISFETAFESLALSGVGSGAVGFVRNQAGRGVRR